MQNGVSNGLPVNGKAHHETMVFAYTLLSAGVRVQRVTGINDDADFLDIKGTGHYNAHVKIEYGARRVVATIYHRAHDADVLVSRVKSPDALRALLREWVIASY